MTKSQQIANQLSTLIRAKNSLIWIVTKEETRVEGYILDAATSAKYNLRTWDCAQGVARPDGTIERIGENDLDYDDILNSINVRASGSAQENRCVWILRDFVPFFAAPATLRRLRNLAKALQRIPLNNAQRLIILTPRRDIPIELADHTTVLEWPLPDRDEIAEMLDEGLDILPNDIRNSVKANMQNGMRQSVIDAAVGLTGAQVQSCYARSLVQLRTIDPKLVATEKKRIIAESKALEWIDPIPGGLDAVGGLDALKSWATQRGLAYSKDARDYGLPLPKGALLVGITGCGKSLTAKAIPTAWNVPLLKWDINAGKGKYLGESEASIRQTLQIIETIGRCVVWLDEIEKTLEGATQGAADGGVSADVLGQILLWMQERSGEAFVFATANDVSKLPPELLRKGRFDQIWSVDLSNAIERQEIILSALAQYNRENILKDWSSLLPATDQFTGAEIAALVPTALFAAYADRKREITTNDLLFAAADTTPFSKSTNGSAVIERLRTWASTNAKPATTKMQAEGF